MEEGPPVRLPNATTINDNKIGHLPLPGLSKKATKTRILADLKSASLVSIPQLTDDGCITNINDKTLTVSKDNKVILTGHRNRNDGLYDITFKSPHPNPKTSLTDNNFKMPCTYNIYSNKATTTKSKQHNQYIKNKTTKKDNQNPYNVDTISTKRLEELIESYKTENTDHAPEAKANVILQKQKKSKELAQFLHACCSSPVISTFINAIKNNHFLS